MQLVSPSRSVPLPMQVAGQIRALIADGSWPVGHRVPSEHELSRDLAISRNSVREALRSLVHAGLLEARPGDGTYVRASSELGVCLHRRLDGADPQDAYEVRALLEQRGARLAARNATPEQHAAMRQALADRDAAQRDGDVLEYFRIDLDFHAMVVAAGGNALLAELHSHIRDAIAGNLRISPDPALGASLDQKHYALVTAIEAGDAQSADAIAGELVAEARLLSARSSDASPLAVVGNEQRAGGK
ncbi:FadR/GntR family transcriptional regulator [Sinomonas terrae]|uniref:FCD domain-containing protein n=1 Tax=Sinomonas terrae TaxID=2908838 RepID=A0ABS9TWC8_9MICC|nr:FCD domain-containing protein [Sinomonas terrae]MCH6468675.1 FCD domain-containing protein [Sinomonas terrae]